MHTTWTDIWKTWHACINLFVYINRWRLKSLFVTQRANFLVVSTFKCLVHNATTLSFYSNLSPRLFILFYFVLFCFILFYFILFYSILFYSIPFSSLLFYSIPFYFILFYFILFYFILFYFILFYFILFYYTK